MTDRMSGTLQENLLTVMSFVAKEGQIVSNLVQVKLFDGDYRIVAERLLDYWRLYDAPPGSHLGDLFADILEDPKNKSGKTFERILENIVQLADSVNTVYVMDQVKRFTTTQNLKIGIQKAAELIHNNQEMASEEVYELLHGLLHDRQVDFSPGSTLSDYKSVLEYMESKQSEFCTGISVLDEKGIIPSRQEVMLFLAPSGRGKTWFLVHIGKMALMRRKRVLHVTLEMSEEQVLLRYYQSFMGAAKRSGKVENTVLEVSDDYAKVITGFDVNKFEPDYYFSSKYISDDMESYVLHQLGPKSDNIRVKQFPSGQLTLENLIAYLDNLEVMEGFIPDIIILDYIGLMKFNISNYRLDLGRVYKEFRGLLSERNVAGVTAQQTSRASFGAKQVRAEDTSEDISLIHTSDVAMSLSSTQREHDKGLARLFLDKVRFEEDRFEVVITQNYGIGQFALDSAVMQRRYNTLFKKEFGSSPTDTENDNDDDEDDDDE